MTKGQLRIFESIAKKKNNRVHINCYSQYGKEISHNTSVLTTKGWKNHGDLKSGDYVFNHFGKKVRINALLKGTNDNKYEVIFTNGEKIVCHSNHEWYLKHRGWNDYKKIETKNILKYKNCKDFSLPNIKPLEFNKKELIIDSYTLGAWLGDGTTTKPSITGHPDDDNIIKNIPYEFSKKHIHKKTGIITYDYWGTDFYKGLKKLGLIIRTGGKGYKGIGTKFIPNIYKQSSKEQKLQLLAGLIDTDGYVSKQIRKDGNKDGRVYFTNTNKKLIDDVIEIIISLGMRPSLVRQKACLSTSGIQGKKDVYIIGFDPFINIPTKLERKKIIPKDKQKRIVIKEINEIKPETGRCINVEGGIYLIGKKLIPTHNSEIVSMAVLTRVSTYPEKWCIVAPSTDKAKIIMGNIIRHIFDNEAIKIKFKIDPAESEERIRRERSKSRLTFDIGNGLIGEVYILSAESHKVGEDAGNKLMGFGAEAVVMDEASLIPNQIFSKVLRMIKGHPNNFLCKIGNPFKRNHFLKSSLNPKYQQIFIDYKQGIEEYRLTEEDIEESKQEQNFDILYECKFPEADRIDEKGFSPLILEDDIKHINEGDLIPYGTPLLGVDVAEAGSNYSVIILRYANIAKVLYRWQTDNTMEIAGRVVECMKKYGVKGSEVFIDTIGVGKGVFDRLLEQNYIINSIKGSEKAFDDKQFENKRAEMYFGLKEWLKQGRLIKDNNWSELLNIKYKVKDSSGRMLIMSKDDMRRYGIESPDVGDAISLTFAIPIEILNRQLISHIQGQHKKVVRGIGFTKNDSKKTFR